MEIWSHLMYIYLLRGAVVPRECLYLIVKYRKSKASDHPECWILEAPHPPATLKPPHLSNRHLWPDQGDKPKYCICEFQEQQCKIRFILFDHIFPTLALLRLFRWNLSPTNFTNKQINKSWQVWQSHECEQNWTNFDWSNNQFITNRPQFVPPKGIFPNELYRTHPIWHHCIGCSYE